MKRVWCSVGMLLLIVFLCGWGVFRVNVICKDTEDLLRRAESCVYLGDYEGARQDVYRSRAIWKKHEGFLGVMLQHTQTGDVNDMFPVLLETVRRKNEDEYYLQNAELVSALQRIRHMEIPYYFNVF